MSSVRKCRILATHANLKFWLFCGRHAPCYSMKLVYIRPFGAEFELRKLAGTCWSNRLKGRPASFSVPRSCLQVLMPTYPHACRNAVRLPLSGERRVPDDPRPELDSELRLAAAEHMFAAFKGLYRIADQEPALSNT